MYTISPEINLGFSKLHAAIMKPLVDSIKCRCFKCRKWKGLENFTLETWEMMNPEDCVCLSCTPCDSHIHAYYEHLEWLEEV